MKTNKEKALERLHFLVYGTNSLQFKDIKPADASKLIELAATPDWYHIDKGEFPEDSEIVLCYIEDDNVTIELEYSADDKVFHEFDLGVGRDSKTHIVKAWTYSPVYK